MESDNRRNIVIDIIKAIGILLVVIGHSDSPISNFISLFHMSLFFFVSGYLYKEKYSTNLMNLTKKRLKSLYKPYLIYSLIFLFLHNVFFKLNIYSSIYSYGNKIIHPYSITEFVKAFLQIILFAGREPMGGAFWFFTSLFFVNIMFGIISSLSLKNIKYTEYARCTMVIILFLIGNLLTKNGITIQRFNNSLVMVSIYYLGYIYHKYEKHINIDNPYFAVMCFVGLIFNNFYGSVSVSSNSYLSPDFMICNSILGIYLSLYIGNYIKNKRILINQLSYIGKNTIVIISLHFISFKLIGLLQIKVCSLPNYYLAKFPVINGKSGWWILYSVAGICIPLFIQFFIIDKVKDIFKQLNYNKVLK